MASSKGALNTIDDPTSGTVGNLRKTPMMNKNLSQKSSLRKAFDPANSTGPTMSSEYGGGNVELVPCESCGRKFNATSLAKHQSMCRPDNAHKPLMSKA